MRLARQRVANRAREDAAAFVGRQDTAGAKHALLDARAFVIPEEERPVLHDRTAGVAAELVLAVRRLRLTGFLREVVVRIE